MPPAPYGVWDWVFIGLLIALFLFVIPRAVMYPVWAWDAISTWGFKAKVFYQRGIVDLGGFEAHNYYPDLVPLLCTYLYLWLGQVNDHLVKLVFPLWGGAFLALLFGMLRRLGLGRTLALGLTAFFALNGITFITHMHIVYADLSLTYFTLGAVGFLYLWLTGAAPPGILPLAALFFAGLPLEQVRGPSPGRDHRPGRGPDSPLAPAPSVWPGAWQPWPGPWPDFSWVTCPGGSLPGSTALKPARTTSWGFTPHNCSRPPPPCSLSC